MSVINGIDYDNLAHIAETSRVPFHVLCERAEKGKPLHHEVRESSMEWVGYQEAAQLLYSPQTTIASAFTTNSGMQLEYWGIEWKTKSLIKPKAKRGCGVLFKRADIIVVNNIRIGAHISLIAALKVFQAMEQGKI